MANYFGVPDPGPFRVAPDPELDFVATTAHQAAGPDWVHTSEDWFLLLREAGWYGGAMDEEARPFNRPLTET